MNSSEEKFKELTAQQKEIAKIVNNRMELVSHVTMDILHDNPALKTEVVNTINTNRKAGKDEAIYLRDLLSTNSNLSFNFRNVFLSEFASRLESGDFPHAAAVKAELEIVWAKGRKKQAVSANVLTESTNWDFDYVLMAHIGSYMYFPYSEIHQGNNSLNFYYVNAPLDPNATTATANYTDQNGFAQTLEVNGSDDWPMQNPTLVFLLDDGIAGNHLDNYEASACANGDFMQHLCPTELIPDLDAGGPIATPPPPPPNPSYNGPLENNIPPSFHASITNDQYLLSASIPKVSLKQNLRRLFWNGSNRISMYRGRARIVNADRRDFNEAVFIDSGYAVLGGKGSEFIISRNQARNQVWVDANTLFTEQWKQEEADNYVCVTFVEHWLTFNGPKINYNANVGVYWDTTTVTRSLSVNGVVVTYTGARGWTPRVDANVQLQGSIEVRTRAQLFGEINLNRASFLSNAMGNSFGLGVCGFNTGAYDCERA